MSKIYAIKLNNGNLHKNNLGEIVYFSNKNDVRAYMKHNHYDGIIQPINIDLKKDRKIADLEAKLAESEREHELLIDQFEEETEKLRKQIKQESDARKRFVEAVKELKQQLAEKEKENELMAKTLRMTKYIEKEIDQDKISFAVEQLEQLRHDIWTNQQDDGYTDMQVDLYDLNDTIDVRIMQLKEMK